MSTTSPHSFLNKFIRRSLSFRKGLGGFSTENGNSFVENEKTSFGNENSSAVNENFSIGKENSYTENENFLVGNGKSLTVNGNSC